MHYEFIVYCRHHSKVFWTLLITEYGMVDKQKFRFDYFWEKTWHSHKTEILHTKKKILGKKNHWKKKFIVIFVQILEVSLPNVCNLLKIGTLYNFQIKPSHVNGYIQNHDRGKH